LEVPGVLLWSKEGEMVDFYTNNFADNIRLARSKRLIAPADDVYNVIRIPRYALVLCTRVWIETAYTNAGALMTVGFVGNKDTADPDAFMTTALCDPDATGMAVSYAGNAACCGGKYFQDGSGSITITVDDNGGTAGTFYVFAEYVVVH
jgi:hypothetical protein